MDINDLDNNFKNKASDTKKKCSMNQNKQQQRSKKEKGINTISALELLSKAKKQQFCQILRMI